jgi:arylformamidase
MKTPRRRVWDISPVLQPGMPVWPGDSPFTQERTLIIGPDCPVNVSRLSLSTHTGAHTDAPFHYDRNGASIGEVDLDVYLGECRIIHAIGTARVELHHLAGHLDDVPERVLFRTYQSSPVNSWDSDFAAVSPDVIEALDAAGVRLVGIDTPSLDPESSTAMLAHKAILKAGMAILESVVLDDIAEGDYELIALPLKMVGSDASPVRAILRAI